MTVITLANRPVSPQTQVNAFHDAVLEAGTITITNDSFATAQDRIYDVRGMSTIHSEIENTNASNALIYRIEKCNTSFTDISLLIDADFDSIVKANTTVSANVTSTGTVTCATAVAGNTVTVNGLLYTGVTGAKANDTEFSVDTGNNECALDLADSIDDDTRQGTLLDVTATSSSAVVTIVSTAIGTAGNAVTLVSSGSTVAVSGSGTFTGGVNSFVIDNITGVSPETTAIRVRVRRETDGNTSTLAGKFSAQ